MLYAAYTAPPDDKLVCSKHVEGSITETNEGYRCVCYWSCSHME